MKEGPSAGSPAESPSRGGGGDGGAGENGKVAKGANGAKGGGKARKAKVIALSLLVVLAFAGGGVTAFLLGKDSGGSGESDDQADGKKGGRDRGGDQAGQESEPDQQPSEDTPSEDESEGESDQPVPNPKPHEYNDIDLPGDYHLYFADDPVDATKNGNKDADVKYRSSVIPDQIATDTGNKFVLLNDAQKGSLKTCEEETRFTDSIELNQLSKGSEVCVRTASGHIGLLTFRGMAPESDPSDYIKLDLTVWRNAIAPEENDSGL